MIWHWYAVRVEYCLMNRLGFARSQSTPLYSSLERMLDLISLVERGLLSVEEERPASVFGLGVVKGAEA